MSLITNFNSQTSHRMVYRPKNSTSEKIQKWDIEILIFNSTNTEKQNNKSGENIHSKTNLWHLRTWKEVLLSKNAYHGDWGERRLQFKPGRWREHFMKSDLFSLFKYLWHDVDIFCLFKADVMELKAGVWEATGMRPRTQKLEFLVIELWWRFLCSHHSPHVNVRGRSWEREGWQLWASGKAPTSSSLPRRWCP